VPPDLCPTTTNLTEYIILNNYPILKKRNDMKEFKGEIFSEESAEKHLRILKTKLTDKKHADNLADQNLENAKMALIEAQQAVQAAKELKNKTKVDAKGADDEVLDFSKAMEITPFTGRIKKNNIF
jgi:hypothetical protein